ncbi:MAG TPA: histidine kinase dimerization/phospho-acceptor domain-containing protein, partial [bacterium]|nr:histidine kinase dimerization/phospho-acceptor domain-containing protein [bacterium]
MAWAIVNLIELGDASDAILKENYKSILAAENMIDMIERQDSASLLTLLGYKDDGSGQFESNGIRFSEWLGRAKDNITIEGEAEILSGIEKSYSKYLSSVASLVGTESLSLEQRKAYYRQRVLPDFLEVRNLCVRLREINQETMYEASEKARRLSRRAVVSTGAIGVATICIGVFFSLFLSNLVVRPIREMIAATKKVSDGDYEVEIAGRFSDELGVVIDEFNEMVRRLRKFRDLNIMKILEEKSKSEAIIREIDDGIVVVDSELKITNINPVASNILDLDIDKAIGRHFLESVKSEKLFDHLKATMESGKSPNLDESGSILTVKRKGRVSHYLFSVTPVSSGLGNLRGVALLLRDITKLKELDQMKSDFISTASHELRTPLTTIEMSVGLLMEKEYENLDEKGKELLDAAQEELARLKALINDLLDLSRIESGKVLMNMEPVSASELIEKTAKIMQKQADERTIELETEAEAALPPVKADANKITWVIT